MKALEYAKKILNDGYGYVWVGNKLFTEVTEELEKLLGNKELKGVDWISDTEVELIFGKEVV